MLAYKFLSRGAVAPFTGFRWPTPRAGGAPGPWVEAPPGDLLRSGVHACGADDLPLWPDEELWRVELGGTIREAPHQLAAERGRLVRRIDRWDAQLASAYGGACALRARDLAAGRLEQAGLSADAGRLRASGDLAALAACAAGIAGDLPPSDPRGLAAYVAGAAARAAQGRAPEASLHHVNLAAAVDPAHGAAAERRWQARWLASALALDA